MNIRLLYNSLLKSEYITIHESVKVIIKTANHWHKYSHELVVGLVLLDFFIQLYSYYCGVWQGHKTMRHIYFVPQTFVTISVIHEKSEKILKNLLSVILKVSKSN